MKKKKRGQLRPMTESAPQQFNPHTENQNTFSGSSLADEIRRLTSGRWPVSSSLAAGVYQKRIEAQFVHLLRLIEIPNTKKKVFRF